MFNANVVVKYNSYFDNVEIGDLTCSTFESFLDFCEYVVEIRKLIPLQLKHDPQYRDIHEARVDVFVDGTRQATIHFRRALHDEGEINAFSNSRLLT